MIGPLKNLVLTEDGRTKPAGVVAVVIVLVVSGAAMGYYVWNHAELGGGAPQVTSGHKCYSCGYISSVKLVVGEPTTTCPRCGKPTFRLAHKCRKCGTLEVLNEDRGLKPPTKCPKCGGEIRYGD